MSRIGRMPITVPAGVTVSIADGNVVTVKGPKGELKRALQLALGSLNGNHITLGNGNGDAGGNGNGHSANSRH